MSEPLSFSEKQQRLQNILSAGNLWYGRQSALSLENIEEAQNQALEQNEIISSKLTDVTGGLNTLSTGMSNLNTTASKQLGELEKQTELEFERMSEEREARIKEEQRRIRNEYLKKLNFYSRELFFHLSKELKDLETSNLPNLEKYFLLMSQDYMMKKYEITTELTNDLNEKKIISDTLDKIKNMLLITYRSLTKEDNEDLNSIFEIADSNQKIDTKKLKKEKTYLESLPKKIEFTQKSEDLFEIVSQNKKIVTII